MYPVSFTPIVRFQSPLPAVQFGRAKAKMASTPDDGIVSTRAEADAMLRDNFVPADELLPDANPNQAAASPRRGLRLIG